MKGADGARHFEAASWYHRVYGDRARMDMRSCSHGGRSYPIYGIWKMRLFYSAVRIAKRLLGQPKLSLPRGSGPIEPAHFENLLRRAGLEPTKRTYTSFLGLLSPLDEVLPHLAARSGEMLERREFLASRLARQLVFVARCADGETARRRSASLLKADFLR